MESSLGEGMDESSSSWLITEDNLLTTTGENFTTETPFFFDPIEHIFYFKTPEDMLNPAKRNPAFYPIVVTHAITFILGIVGNVVAVTVMIGDRKGRSSATNLFLVSLSAADSLLLLFCIPLEVIQYFLVFEDNGVICKMARYTELLSASASILNLCAVSLERFIVIVFPMRSRSVCTQSNCRKALCCVWVLALTLSVPVILTKEGYSVTYTNNKTSVTVYYCEEENISEGFPVAIYKFIILFAAPAILMIICYFHVIRELWRSTRNIQLLTNSKSIRASSSVSTGERKPLNNAKYSPTPLDNSKGNLEIPGTAGAAENNKTPSPASVSRRSSQQPCINITHHGTGAASTVVGNGGGDDENRKSTPATSSGSNTASAACAKYLNHNGHHNHHHNNASPSRELLKPNSASGVGLQQQQNRRGRNQSKLHKGDEAKRARKQVIKMLILIIFLFLICWGPKLILNIVLKLSVILGLPIYSPEVYTCRVIFSLIPFVHSCINPIVYSFMSKNFRRSMNRQLGQCCTTCRCRKCNGNCRAHRNSIPLSSTARTRTTSHAIESTYCQISDMASTRHTELEGISAI